MEAFMKEWKGLWGQEVFDFSTTREYLENLPAFKTGVRATS